MKRSRWKDVLRIIDRQAAPLLALLLIGLVYFMGIRSERTGFVDEVLDPGLKRITHPVLNAFRGKPPTVPLLDLHLDVHTTDSLTALQEKALGNGWLDASENHWLTAEAEILGRTYAAAIRLQEGPVDRELGQRWPYTVHLHGADTAPALFDLMPVRDALPVYGKLFQRALGELGIPSAHHDLVDLRLNGKDKGLHLLEGHMDSVRLRHLGRRGGPVLWFDDALNKHARRGMEALSFPIDPPARTEWLSAPALSARTRGQYGGQMERHRTAIASLESFRAGRATASEVFDADLLARFLALCDILGAQESAQWWNLRFLADSAGGKLIVYPRRILAGVPITAITALRTGATISFPSSANTITGRFLGDPVVYTGYMAWLDSLSREGWVEALLQRHTEEMELMDRIVRGEYPQHPMDPDVLTHGPKVVRMMVHPRDPVLAYSGNGRPGRRSLSIANVHDLPVVLAGYVTGGDTMALDQPLTLPPREREIGRAHV